MRAPLTKRVLSWLRRNPAPGDGVSVADARRHMHALRLVCLLGEGQMGREQLERENRMHLRNASETLRSLYP